MKLKCPYCKREIAYDYCATEIDNQLIENNKRLAEIEKRLHEIKSVIKTESIKREKMKLSIEKMHINEQQFELKLLARQAKRKQVENRHEQEFNTFKRVVKEHLGNDEEYQELLLKAFGENKYNNE